MAKKSPKKIDPKESERMIIGHEAARAYMDEMMASANWDPDSKEWVLDHMSTFAYSILLTADKVTAELRRGAN